jgi:hypothetical protein
MRQLIVLLILSLLAWSGYRHFNAAESPAAPKSAANPSPSRPAAAHMAPDTSPGYTCDGRTHCSQMRSCAEAKYFLKHCPNTKMDGNGDGVPCERQWCG